MKRFISINNYGLQKYILKENVELPSIENSNLLNIGEKVTYFSDIKWAMTSDIPLNTGQINHQIKTKILASARVLAVIEY
jgi:hypothetical protein